jgi:hypothetical protein
LPSAQDRQRAKNAFLAHGGIEGYTSETEWWADVILTLSGSGIDVLEH